MAEELESDFCSVEVKVIRFRNEIIKDRDEFSFDDKIKEVKSRLLEEQGISDPAKNYQMIIKFQEAVKVLDDNERVSAYAADLAADCQVEIIPRK